MIRSCIIFLICIDVDSLLKHQWLCRTVFSLGKETSCECFTNQSPFLLNDCIKTIKQSILMKRQKQIFYDKKEDLQTQIVFS